MNPRNTASHAEAAPKHPSVHSGSAAGPSAPRADESARDQEALWQIEQTQQRLRLATQAAALGMWDYHPASGVLELSDRSKQLLGLPRDVPVCYDLFRAALHADDRPHVDAAVEQSLHSGGTREFDIEFRVVGLRDGNLRWIRAHGQALCEADQTVRVIAAMQDITNHKQAEQSLQEADRRKDEFLATLSHELRNPLTPITSSLDFLRMQAARIPELREPVDVMQRQVEQIVRLVNDLLDVSRIARGRIELKKERVLLSRLIEHAASAVQPMIDSAGLRLQLELTPQPLVLDADPQRLEQVITNLLHNAIRYTESGGMIRIVTERVGNNAVIRVADTGIGIPTEMLGRVFDMFWQVDNSLTRKRGGLGIGLTVVQKLVELHEGAVEAVSAGIGQGSEFIVRLPLALGLPPRVQQRQPAPRTLRKLPPRRVLVVDDTRDAATMLARLLAALGQEVQVAYDGHAALAAAQEQKPHLVISDIAMPGMDGYSLAERLRARPEFNDVPLIALTGYGQQQDRRRALEAGFNYHLVKPITLNTLEEVLSEITLTDAETS